MSQAARRNPWARAFLVLLIPAALPLAISVLYLGPWPAIFIFLLLVLISRRWRSSHLMDMAARQLLRNPGISASMVLAMAVSACLICTPFVLQDSLNGMVWQEAERTMGGGDALYVHAGGANATAVLEARDAAAASAAVQKVCSLAIATVPALAEKQGMMIIPEMRLILVDSILLSTGVMISEGKRVIYEPETQTILINDLLAAQLGVVKGDYLVSVKGNNTIPLLIAGVVLSSGLGGLGGAPDAFANPRTFSMLTGSDAPDHLLMWFTEADRGDPARVRSDAAALSTALSAYDMLLQTDRGTMIEENGQSMNALALGLGIFGAFSILAGVSVVMVLFSGRLQGRQQELALLRALGVDRRGLIAIFLAEGGVLCGIGAAAGAALSSLVAYWMMNAVGNGTLVAGLPISSYFQWRPSVLIVGYLIALASGLAVIVWVGRRQTAWKNSGTGRMVLLDRWGAVALTVLGAIGLTTGTATSSVLLALTGASLVLLGISLDTALLRWIRVFSLMLSAASWILFPILAAAWLPLTPELILLSALFLMVDATLLLAMALRMVRVRTRKPTLQLAMRYLAADHHLFLALFTFATLVLAFTLVNTAQGLVQENVSSIVGDMSAGYDLIGYTTKGALPQSLDATLAAGGMQFHADNASRSVSIYSTECWIGLDGEGPKKCRSLGFDPALSGSVSYALAEFDPAYPDETSVWTAMAQDPSLLVVDGETWASSTDISQGSERLKIGQVVNLTSVDGVECQLKVVGVMKQRTMALLLMSPERVRLLGAEGPSFFLIDLRQGLDPAAQAALLERDLLPYGLSIIDVQLLQANVQGMADGALAVLGGLLWATALVAQIGILAIWMRNVQERRPDLAILRALGAPWATMRRELLMEGGIVLGLGAAVGIAVGVFMMGEVWALLFRAQGLRFALPSTWLLVDLLVVLVAPLAILFLTLGGDRGRRMWAGLPHE